MLEHTTLQLDCLGGGHDRVGSFGSGDHRLLVVADGAGGATGAALAANLVVELVREVADAMTSPLGPLGLRDLLERLDRLLLSSASAGQSTAVIVEVVHDRFWGASVGDSGAWLTHDGAHIDLTQGQHRKWRLGTGLATPVWFGPLPLVGTLLLATDGLFDCATEQSITSAVDAAPLSDVLGTLAARVRAPNGMLRDDLGVVLCRSAVMRAQLAVAS